MKLNPQFKMRSPRVRHSRTKRPAAKRVWRPATILVPTDFSYAADHALSHAVQLAGRRRTGLALLHVVTPVLGPDLLFTSIRMDQPLMAKLSEQRLARLAQRMKLHPRRQAVRVGSAAEEILRFAEEIKADLIVIGSHGHGALERMLIGGTTERVVRHAHCPVLVVPPPEGQKNLNRSKPRQNPA